MRMLACAVAIALIASPVMAKRGADIGCVPSPDPNVPPCNLDQSPMVPSLVEAQTKEGASRSRARTPHVRGGKAARGVKGPIGCVPSPDPNVPPCDLDQTPVMPSDLENAAGEKEKPQENAVPVKAHKTPSYSAKKPTGKAKP